LVDEAFPLLSGGGRFGIAWMIVLAKVESWILSLGLIDKAEVDQVFEVLTIINVLLDSKSWVWLGVLWEVFESDSILVLIVESWLNLWEDLHRHLLIVADLIGVTTLLGGEEIELSLLISEVVW